MGHRALMIWVSWFEKQECFLQKENEGIKNAEQSDIGGANRQVVAIGDAETKEGGDAAEERSHDCELAHAARVEMGGQGWNEEESERDEGADAEHGHRDGKADEQVQ